MGVVYKVAESKKGARKSRRSAGRPAGITPVLKEVVVFRDPPVVHLYDVVSHGRRFFRQLVHAKR